MYMRDMFDDEDSTRVAVLGAGEKEEKFHVAPRPRERDESRVTEFYAENDDDSLSLPAAEVEMYTRVIVAVCEIGEKIHRREGDPGRIERTSLALGARARAHVPFVHNHELRIKQ